MQNAESRKTFLTWLFHLADVDKSGTINQEELGLILQALSKYISRHFQFIDPAQRRHYAWKFIIWWRSKFLLIFFYCETEDPKVREDPSALAQRILEEYNTGTFLSNFFQ